MHTLFDIRPERPGFRLHRLEVFNWGTFDSKGGEVYRFEPEGRTALLVGKNGSGKSTLVDAILTLLVEPRTRNYNVAAGGHKRERTEQSYVRGAYSRSSDDAGTAVTQFLRPKAAHLTALLAAFRDEQLDREFTLCQVLHLSAGGGVEKLFAVADEGRDLKTDLAGIHSSDAVGSHLQELGYKTTKKFIEYHGWLKKRTGARPKAMDMFNQTVAVKDIQSLNAFLRLHMLEPHDWQEAVKHLLKHFNDLSTAHQELVCARKAEELLRPVEKRGSQYRNQEARLTEAQRKLAAADLFFRDQTVRLFEPEIEAHQRQLTQAEAAIDRLTSERTQLLEKVRQLKNEIDHAGGDRLRAIPGEIESEKGKLAIKQPAFARFHRQLKLCNVQETVGNSSTFGKVREKLQAFAVTNAEQIVATESAHEELVSVRGKLRRDLREETEELEVLARRKTNLPAQFTAIRQRLCEDLQIAERDVPFAAELIAVDPDERLWEASAEMVLRSFALSLLVPDRLYRRVRDYIEEKRIEDARGEGRRLDYLRVGRAAVASGDRVHPQSLLRKLKFRDRHPLTPWVRGEIEHRFNYQCCQSVEEMGNAPRFAMTANRHVKVGGDLHKKDDRTRTIDPRYFVLGWNNQAKKLRIAERIEVISTKLASLTREIDAKASELEQLRAARIATKEVLEITEFDTIDVERHRKAVRDLETEQRQLEQSNDTVRVLKKKLSKAESKAKSLESDRDGAIEKRTELRQQLEDGKRLIANAVKQLEAAKLEGEFEAHAEMFSAIGQSLGRSLSIANLVESEKAWMTETGRQIEKLRGPLQSLSEKLIESMSRYLREFKEQEVDLTASLQSLDSFLGLLDQVCHEDLPRHEKKFKDRLNDKVSQEVALFNAALKNEQSQIVEKIDQLNQALGQLEYQSGTFMRLEPRQVQDREIEDFRRSLRECLDESFENSDEANEARFLRIQKLVQQLGDPEKTRWRDKVIDVRNWFTFAAHEMVKETGETRSFHEGSSGQSGGEKAKLAFTILVAAIAYQYDLDPEGRTPGRFGFVVVDEMFSKVDDHNANYALKLFEQFGLQLLIVAPLDAKARVTEPFVDTYLQVVKDEATGRSQLFSMTAREYEEVVEQFTRNGKPAGRRLSAK